MNRLSPLLSLVLIGLIAIPLTNSIGDAKALSRPNSALICGEWIDESADYDHDDRIGVTPEGIENDCSGIFTLQNQTGSPGKALSGYSLAITPTSNNADVQFSQYVPILMPGLDMQVTTTPTSISRGATVQLKSGVTLLSAAADADLFILDSIFALLPEWCVPSPKEVLFISLRTAPILEDTVHLALQGDIAGSVEEAFRLNREFYKKVMEAAEELTIDCIIEYYSGDFAPVVNIAKPYLSWLGSAYFGYLEYGEGGLAVGPLVLLAYLPPLPPTPIPPALDKNDLSSVMQWMANLMKQKEARQIIPLIGSYGTRFAGYAIGVNPKGYNNSDEIFEILEKALGLSEPICLGYNPNFGSLPDKAIIYHQGLNFEETEIGTISKDEVVGFQFFNLENGWELIFITPIPAGAIPDPQSLSPCPVETSNPLTAVP